MGTAHLSPLLDLDILQYRCGFAADSQMKKEAREAEPDANDERIMEMLQEVDYKHIALGNVKHVITEVLQQYEGKPQMYIQGEGNFRYDVATLKPYKGNRDKSHKPKYAKEIRAHSLGSHGFL